MQTQLTLNIDNQTVELANFYAKEKGISVNEMVENTEKLKDLEWFLTLNRFEVPVDYKFNRNELYDR